MLHDPGSFSIFSCSMELPSDGQSKALCVYVLTTKRERFGLLLGKVVEGSKRQALNKNDYYFDGFSCNVNVKFLSVHCVIKPSLNRLKTKTTSPCLKRYIIILSFARQSKTPVSKTHRIGNNGNIGIKLFTT